jgi:uncharacterized protein (TIGR02145 family)
MRNFTKLFLAAYLLTGLTFSLNAQSVGINAGGSAPDNSAMLDVNSDSKGFLPPRMTTIQRNEITAPAEGLVIYNTDEETINFFNGTTWSLLSSVVCGQTFRDPRDAKIYPTVQIGTQCWMAKNLNAGTRINGSMEQTNNNPTPFIEKYCYDNSEANCEVYGGLYQWDEMMQYSSTPGKQGICPTGWHLPTDAEWTTLTTYLGGESVAGGKMKETGTTHWFSPNTGATNSSGFTGLPGGSRETDGGFYDLSWYGDFWSSSQNSAANLNCLSRFISLFNKEKAKGLSVRCIRD